MDNFTTTYNFTKDEWDTCLKVLTELKKDPFHNPDNTRFASLITKIHKQAKKTNRKQSYTEKKSNDLQIINGSVISQKALHNETSFDHSSVKSGIEYSRLEIPKNCYCCNESYVLAHSFYNRLCPNCATINYENRFKKIDLSNRNVILTGGRVKIGYATALKLLRSNANLTVTTRFPGLALEHYKKESDYHKWKDRLTLYGLDLRNLNSIQKFIEYYRSKHDTLDILINNAAQTIKYTDAYYLPLIQREKKTIATVVSDIKLIRNETPITKSLTALESVTDSLELNRFGQPMASTFKKKFIINVTSSEGQFSYTNKSIFHPHTNMTKASLNMLTRTSARAYEKNGIYMNAVDVGWVSTGAQEALRKKQFDTGYIPPLDPVDGASRILVPIIEGITNKHNHVGKLLKNYKIASW